MKTLVEMINDKKSKKYSDKDMLSFGKLVEMEHVHHFPNMDKDLVAEMIAIDHLKENPNYYIKLFQAGLIDEKEAIEYYNNFLRFRNDTENSVEEV